MFGLFVEFFVFAVCVAAFVFSRKAWKGMVLQADVPRGNAATEFNAKKSVLLLAQFISAGAAIIPVAFFAFSVFVSVPTSYVAVTTSFGEVVGELPEGMHVVPPWYKLGNVFVGQDVAVAKGAEAGSKDLQKVHSDLTVNYRVKRDKVTALYRIAPNMQYENFFVVPAIYEAFKSVVGHYTAEELVTKRTEVSQNIITAISDKLVKYEMEVAAVNMVDFQFSPSFNAAIEEKVTSTQKAETAKRQLERVEYEAKQRVMQAEGEAKAIAIQASAIEKQGGEAYIRLKAIEKWNGALPAYMTSGTQTPFIQIK